MSKQLSANKTLRNENEKLSDKVKLIDEKLNHSERDNQQKKQLIEFYKKKLDEAAPSVASAENDVAQLAESRQQAKRAQETIDKLKAELKAARARVQTAVEEKRAADEALAKASGELATVKKERMPRLESSLRQAKARVADLEAQIDSLGQKAETRLKSLAETSQQTVDLAQVLTLNFFAYPLDKLPSFFSFLFFVQVQ